MNGHSDNVKPTDNQEFNSEQKADDIPSTPFCANTNVVCSSLPDIKGMQFGNLSRNKWLTHISAKDNENNYTVLPFTLQIFSINY